MKSKTLLQISSEIKKTRFFYAMDFKLLGFFFVKFITVFLLKIVKNKIWKAKNSYYL